MNWATVDTTYAGLANFRAGHTVTICGHYVVVVGGYRYINGSYVTGYDLSLNLKTNAWTTVHFSGLKTGMWFHATALVDDKLFVIGGRVVFQSLLVLTT